MNVIQRPALAVDQRMSLEFRVGPAQLVLSELLPLPVTALQSRLEAELEANPALELPVPLTCPSCGQSVWRGRCVRCADRSDHYGADLLPRLQAASPPRERLLGDAVAEVARADRRIAVHLVANVDDYGVLDEQVPVIAQRLGVRDADVQRVIAALRQAGFPGLCAGSLVESLRRQAAALDPLPEVSALLAADLGELAAGRLATVAAANGLDGHQLRTALAWLRTHLVLDVFERAESGPVPVVDAVVRRSGDRLRTEVVPGPWSALRVADSYAMAVHDPAVGGLVATASRFVEALGRRERSLAQVCQEVVTYQQARVVHGRSAHRPLTRRDLATRLGLHESTVSRVVAGKHIMLPTGETVALAALFGAGQEVQHCLHDLVRSETSPLSDAALAAALARQGHIVARRTVAKYRAELGIPACTQR